MPTDQDLVAAFLQTRRVKRLPPGRKTYARRAISALAEGPDFKLDQLRADQAAGLLDEFGRKTEAVRAQRRARRQRERVARREVV